MRVQNFPAPGGKVPASEFIITGGGCAANAAVAIARLGGRVAFAGPLGGTDDHVSNRILADLAKEGIDCGGVARKDDGTASVSLILLDATGEKTIATRRGVNLGKALPADAGQTGGGCRCRAGGQPVSRIRHGGVPRRAGAQDPDRHRSRSGDQAGRSAAQARHACGGIGGSFARHDGLERLRRRPAARWPNISPASSPSPTGRTAFIGSTMVRCAICRHSRSR